MSAFKACPIVPVLTIDDIGIAAPLAQALFASGLTTAEITLRTPQALDAIRVMKTAAPELMIGAGTILSAKDVQASLDAGSDFLVTPAMCADLLSAVKSAPVPVFPGVATPSEALEMYSHGLSYVKFFPAEANGGVQALRAMAGPLPHITFMPTGGITEKTAPDYLALPNVIAIGGSWMIDKQALAAHSFEQVKLSAMGAIATL